MSPAGDGQRLPPSIGGLFDLAFAAWVQRAPFYLALGLGVFAVCGAIEALWPAATPQAVELKAVALEYADLFTLSLVVAAVALGVATRVAGERVATRALLAAALERWLAVLGAMIVVQFVFDLTLPLGAIGALPDPPALALLTAPVIWLVWGAIGLAGPIAALSGERPGVAFFSGFTRAVALCARRENLPRVVLLAFANVVPLLLGNVVFDLLTRRGIPHASFWAGIPLDALSVAPLAALQTAFALDFARRAADQRSA